MGCWASQARPPSSPAPAAPQRCPPGGARHCCSAAGGRAAAQTAARTAATYGIAPHPPPEQAAPAACMASPLRWANASLTWAEDRLQSASRPCALGSGPAAHEAMHTSCLAQLANHPAGMQGCYCPPGSRQWRAARQQVCRCLEQLSNIGGGAQGLAHACIGPANTSGCRRGVAASSSFQQAQAFSSPAQARARLLAQHGAQENARAAQALAGQARACRAGQGRGRAQLRIACGWQLSCGPMCKAAAAAAQPAAAAIQQQQQPPGRRQP